MKWKCPKCARERETKENIVMVICPECLNKMEVIKWRKKLKAR